MKQFLDSSTLPREYHFSVDCSFDNKALTTLYGHWRILRKQKKIMSFSDLSTSIRNNDHFSICIGPVKPLPLSPLTPFPLDKIKKGEFINFENLINSDHAKAMQKGGWLSQSETKDFVKSEEARSLYEAQLSSGDAFIATFANWCLAWNRFMDFTIYFRPHLFHELFLYQKIVTNLVNMYNFDAVYAYDKEFRMAMAEQQSLPYEHQKVHWGQISCAIAHKNLPPLPVFNMVIC